MTDQHLTVEQVDPTTLLVDVNIRSDAALDKDFLASIRDLGVLVPIAAVRTQDGALRVCYGHRRTLAAVEAGRGSVPVIVANGDDADEAARIVSQWIVSQWHENEHRSGLSTADKVAAVEQLSLLGLSAAPIVKQTRARKADVEQALATAGSALAKGAATRYEFLTLDQAAAVAEFETEPDTGQGADRQCQGQRGRLRPRVAAGPRRARSRHPGRRSAGWAGRGLRAGHRASRLRRPAQHQGSG
jgi:ParB family transcriptional regulator, chromosome partitioning protein